MNLPQKIGSFTLIRDLFDDGITRSFLGILDEPAGKQVQIRQVLAHVTRDPKMLTNMRLRIGDLLHVNHPYLQPVQDFKLISSSFYLIEEYPEGTSLDRLLRWCRASKSRIPANIYLYLVVNMCTALEALHATAGRDSRTPHILHRAISPRAITITPKGQVILGGCGLVDSPPSLQHALGNEAELRNLEYLSPEQTQPDAALTPASDVFSLASLAYELLTGDPLFRESTQLKTIHAIRKAEVNLPLSNVKRILPGLDKVLFRALSLNPRHRYQRAFVLREDVRALMANFSFANIQNELADFLSKVDLKEDRISTFPGTFGPQPADSDDTSAILRSSLFSGSDTLDTLDTLTDSENLSRVPTAEAFAFLRPSSDHIAPPEAFQGFAAEHTASTTPNSNTPVEDPEDVPAPAGVERTHPEIARAIESQNESHTTWVRTGKKETPAIKEETTAQIPGPFSTEDFGNRFGETTHASDDATAPLKPRTKSKHSEGTTQPTSEADTSAITLPEKMRTPQKRPPASNNTAWMAAGAVTAFSVVALLGLVVLILAIIVLRNPTPTVIHSESQADTNETVSNAPSQETELAEKGGGVENGPVAENETPKPNAQPQFKSRPKPVPPGNTSVKQPKTPLDSEPEITLFTEPIIPTAILEEDSATSFNLNDASSRAVEGRLRSEERASLAQTPKSSQEFSSAYMVLYADAKARENLTEQRMFIEALMTLPENQRNPALLVERAQISIQRRSYDSALKDANLAERHWARLPSKMVFSRKAMIYEAQAAAWQGKFYKSGGSNLMACHRAIQSWERYQLHVSTRGRRDLVRIADKQLAKLQDAKKRLE